MSEVGNNKDNDFFEISFKEIFVSARNSIRKIIFFTILGAIISVIYSLTIPEQYVSQAISVKAETLDFKDNRNNTAGGLLQIFGSGSQSSSTDRILTILKSRNFFRNFYNDDKFLFELMAVQSYDPKVDKYDINIDLYDENKWIQRPSFEESYKTFHQKFKVSTDQITGEIYTTTKHVNPNVALNWNNKILATINKIMKEKQVIKSSSAIDYFRKQIDTETSLNVRPVLLSAMASELQTLATLDVTDEYSLEVIDPPFLPERSAEPNNAVISILGTILSFIVFFLYFIIVDLYRSLKKST